MSFSPGPPSLDSAPAVVVPSSLASLAAVGGGAAPFDPTFDLFFDPSTSGGLLSPCTKHARRSKRRRSRESQPSQRRGNDNFYPPAFAARYAGTKRLGKLYCRTGFHLQIHADGRVNGTRRDNSRFGVLEFLSVAIGLVSIKGKESNRYLCMNQKGKLYGSANHSTDCIFMERMLENYYNTYTSCKYSRKNRKWFVALNKRGRPRKGGRSKKKQKFSQFLVLHLDDDDVGQQKRKNFFKSIDRNGQQLGIGSFTDKWRQSQRHQSQSAIMRVWTRRNDKNLNIINNNDNSNNNNNNNNDKGNGHRRMTPVDKNYNARILNDNVNSDNNNNNNRNDNNGNHNKRRTGWRRAAFVDENG